MLDGVSASAANRATTGSASTLRINQGTTSFTEGTSNFTNAGFKAIVRTSSTNVYIYNRNTRLTRTATSSTVNSTNTQTLFKSNTGFGNGTISIYTMGKSLTDSQENNLSVCITSYVNSL
jgi:hypothetical protein